jgi:hypothetical protein
MIVLRYQFIGDFMEKMACPKRDGIRGAGQSSEIRKIRHEGHNY